ncbi:MAG: FAD-dependent monooxygenase, partial [Candidatus Dadabacteria bacterium]|nr:FAD-dependent monooxygenase [Candidatus Dadabacteria bacterium]
ENLNNIGDGSNGGSFDDQNAIDNDYELVEGVENRVPAAHFADLTYVTYFSDPVEWFFLLKTREFWRCMLPTPDGAIGEGLLDEKNVQNRLNRIVPNDEPYQVVHRTLYRIHQRVAATYRVGSIFLAGDSAHINNPLGGMGMNGGIHDAVNLAEKIVAVLRGAPDELLDRYDRPRRNIALEYVQTQSVRNREILTATDPKKRKENFGEGGI